MGAPQLPQGALNAIPAKVRAWVYAIASLVLYVVSVWQASDGNWVVTVVTFLTALVAFMAHQNTPSATG